ncbi:CheR family methyltransferase [Sporocytophaga myxococcoides]|uniref:CheR family methyltransferase n=1 Tax=Sporocytophaga myxococcoides TaxID=153721 RepID=UPI000402D6A1|nr:protein-glutamate O-methyltransferase CheR [Sporocytophaga myxococcoides]
MGYIEIDDEAYQDLLMAIMGRYSYDFSGYSRASMNRRISRFMINKNLETVSELKFRILADTGYFESFLEEVTVNVTEMFRDPSFYLSLRKNVVPYLKTYPYVRVWDAGCSTGEETYSLAMLLKEESVLTKSRIYATDINGKVLQTAKEGIYPISCMKEYSRNYLEAGGLFSLSDYYHARYNRAIMDSELSKNFLFSIHNLVHDGSFNEFNLILCRNVLIYFQKELQEKVLELFMDSLPVFGFLALGNKESLRFSKIEKYFQVIDQKEKIYRRIN